MAERDSPRPKRRAKAPDLPESPGPVEIAMAAAASGKPLPEAARTVLEKHASLIDIQCQHEREQVGYVRVQRITRWLILGAIAALLLGIAALVRSASVGQALVVEPFKVPPVLAQAGVGGEVMATRVMDQIAKMQAQTLSMRPASTYSTNWGDDIKVSIPNTGATIGDVRRLLRGWFGKETRISGEAVRLGDQWTVTARVTGHTAVSATDPDLEAATKTVAEGVFQQTQPFRYVIYLNATGRNPEARAAARELALKGPEKERPWGLVVLANSMDPPEFSLAEREVAARRAAEAVPDFPMPVGNYGGVLTGLGRWEEGLAAMRRSESLIGDGEAISEEFRAQSVASAGAASAMFTGAFHDAATRAEAGGRVGTPFYATQWISMAIQARYLEYDIRGGDRNLAWLADVLGFNVRAAGQSSVFNTANSDLSWKVNVAQVRIVRASQLVDRAALRAAAIENLPIVDQYIAGFPPAIARDEALAIWPGLTPALVLAGMANVAEQRLRPMPLDCYPCAVARGDAAAGLGKRAEAKRWYAHARKIGPSFPFPDEALGRMLMASGDDAGALKAFQRASRIEPRYADAHKGAGDALRHLRRPQEAAASYALAARHAPRWGRLHLAWADALWSSGRRDEAVAKLRLAQGMDLGGEDRRRLALMLQKARRA